MKNSKSKIMPTLNTLLVSGAAILLSLVIAAVIMAIVGYNPVEAYSAMLEGAFGSRNSIANTLAKSTPLIFVGMSCAYSNKGGIFNIGGEGQLYMGAFVSTIVALALPDAPGIVMIILCIVAAMFAGGLVGAFNGFLKAKLQINEVIVAIMLNYIIRFFTSYWVNGPLKQEGAQTPQTAPVNESYMFTKLIPKTQLTTAFLLAVAAVIIIYVFFEKTRMGYNIRAVGENGLAAQASGIAMTATIIMTMGVSGAFAGLAGMTEVFGKTGNYIDGFSPGYGFTGIAVAFLGKNNPFGVLLGAILFGIIEAGSMKMSYKAGVSTSMINVMQGLVILFVATPNLMSFMNMKKRKGGNK